MQLNPNLKERRMGYFFMLVFALISIFYLFYDGWLYEWVEYGFAGANQHWDLKIFEDMQYTIVDGVYIYTATHNLMHFIYLCYWTAAVCYWYLITGNKWLRQGAIATMAFPVMSFFSTINPLIAKDIFTLDVFLFHSYYLQIAFDMNHIAGSIMGFYIFYTAMKEDDFKMNIKMMTPFILATWVFYLVTRVIMVPTGMDTGYYDTNQINNMPFVFYGLEYLIVVGILFGINFGIKSLIKKLPTPKTKAIVPYVIFATLTIAFVLAGLIVLQNIPYTQFVQ
ncbi:MAG: hypothetical protein ACTSWW_08450 [Promethearchaeota archaeon]